MITLITGAPGSGKTLLCVARFIIPALEKPMEVITPTGEKKKIQRRILTNVNGLVLDHEKIDDSDDHGLRGWFKWCKPGDLIVYDEAQKVWENAPNGSKLPEHIKELQTHRHHGIDIVILTQGPGLIHTAVRDLIGQHIHVRRLGSMHRAITYEWDCCNRSLNYKNAFKKANFTYPKKVFQLYKSADLHTPQNKAFPPHLIIAFVAIIAAVFFATQTALRISAKTSKDVESTDQAKSTPKTPTPNNSQSSNPLTNQPRLDDLIMTGQINADPHLTTWQWIQSGQVRYGLTGDLLALYGLRVVQFGVCQMTLEHVHSGSRRDFACMPGLPSLTSTQAPAVAPSSPLI